MRYKIDPTKLEIYAETAKRRYLVGILSYQPQKNNYTFSYQLDYMQLKTGIPLGPDFTL